MIASGDRTARVSQPLLALARQRQVPGPGRYRPRSAHRPPPLALAFMTSDTRSVTTAEDGSRFASTTSYIPFSGPKLSCPRSCLCDRWEAVATILWQQRRPQPKPRIPGCYQPGAVALSLITAGRKAAGVLDTSRRVCRQLAPEGRRFT